jgi:hypothetical protein
MSPDWSEMYALDGKDFIPDTKNATSGWVSTYIDAADQPRVLSVIHEAIRNKSVFQLEHRVIRADGSMGWVLSRAIPLLDEHGKVTEWFGAARDITVPKQMEVDLREAHSKLEMQVRQRTEELEKVQGDLRDLSAKLLQLQDEERRRIARDLHDSAGADADRSRHEPRSVGAIRSEWQWAVHRETAGGAGTPATCHTGDQNNVVPASSTATG